MDKPCYFEGDEYCERCVRKAVFRTLVAADRAMAARPCPKTKERAADWRAIWDKIPEVEAMPPEVDRSLRCDTCHCPLDHCLTSHGVRRSIEEIENELTYGLDSSLPELEGFRHHERGYYWGQPTYAPLRDTATNLLNYALDAVQLATVKLFLRACRMADMRFKENKLEARRWRKIARQQAASRGQRKT